MILFYIMKFFFYNNLSDSEIIKNTFVNHCSILKIENDSSVMSAKTLIGKTVHFREKNMRHGGYNKYSLLSFLFPVSRIHSFGFG